MSFYKRLALLFSMSAVFLVPSGAFALTWQPLIIADDFNGVRGDVFAAAGGVLSVLLIVLGIGVLYRIFK